MDRNQETRERIRMIKIYFEEYLSMTHTYTPTPHPLHLLNHCVTLKLTYWSDIQALGDGIV